MQDAIDVLKIEFLIITSVCIGVGNQIKIL
jgi:hypothetical protein